MITQSLVELLKISDGLEQLLTIALQNELLLYRVNFMVKPNGLLVLVSSTHCCAYTSAYQRGSLPRPFRRYNPWEISS